MSEIDKTKDNIKLHELDDFQKRELFNKFKDAGGEVVSERQKRRNLIIDRKKQAEHQKRLDEHYKRSKMLDSKKQGKRKVSSSVNRSNASTELRSDYFSRFRIRMRLRLYGVTKFNTVFFNPKFFRKFNNEYKKALMELQMIYFYFFKQDPRNGNRIISRLDKINPIYFELIEKIGELFDQMRLDQILEHHSVFPDIAKPLSELANPINELFREIYIVKGYENQALSAFEKTLDIYDRLTEKSEKRYKKKDIKNALFIVFHKLYPRLHTLFSHYQSYLFDEIDPNIEDILSIAQNEFPGHRKAGGQNSSNFDVINDELEIKIDDEKDKEENSDPFLKKGLEIMSMLNLEEIEKSYTKKHDIAFIEESNSVLKAHLYFVEFEKEYSFILTSNKIKYDVDFSDKDRVDYKQRMQDHFNEMRKCQDAFNLYLDSYESFNKIRSQKPMSQDQYIAYSKRLDDSIKRRDQIGKTVCSTIKSFMEKLSLDLENLIKDMDEAQKYISNPQDILCFEYEIEGDKKLNNTKVFEAIKHVNSYAVAFAHRLGIGGDLGFNRKSQSYEKNEEPSTASDSNGGSVLEELDDIL